MKTCTILDYSGQIMNFKSDGESNELGILYSFAFPLRIKVAEEFLITDTIELVGSVGGLLGLFIGFSFSNTITCIMGCIESFLTSSKKLSETVWASIGWIIYLLLMIISLWFAWEELDKFFKQDTSIQLYEEKIEIHPTIVVCMGSSKYEADFFIKYGVAELLDWTNLTIGQNYLDTLNETVTITTLHTR